VFSLRRARAFPAIAGIVSLCLFCALCLPPERWKGVSPAAGAKPAPGIAIGSSPFAITDFNGDHLLDVATVGIERFGSHSTDYLVRVRLGSTTQSLRAIGPFGAPEISARDVNGDSAPDVIVGTSGQSRPLAIFLNDGQGNFKRADVAGFPDLVWNPRSCWTRIGERVQNVLAFIVSSKWMADAKIVGLRHSDRELPQRVSSGKEAFRRSPLCFSHFSRPPPLLT